MLSSSYARAYPCMCVYVCCIGTGLREELATKRCVEVDEEVRFQLNLQR